MCDSHKEVFSEGKHNLETTNTKIYDNFIIDDSRQIIYCFIPKVIYAHKHAHTCFALFWLFNNKEHIFAGISAPNYDSFTFPSDDNEPYTFPLHTEL